MMTKAALFVEMEPCHTNIEAIENSSPLSTGFGLTGVSISCMSCCKSLFMRAGAGGSLEDLGGSCIRFQKNGGGLGQTKLLGISRGTTQTFEFAKAVR